VVVYFKEAKLRDKPIQAGRLESIEAIQLQPDEVRTYMLDVQGDQAAAICSIPGIWAPEVGTPVQLQDPERVATVQEVAYLFDATGFGVSVWLRDPLTQVEGSDA
jgi:hypothetical protein